jgi:hypothetical protein
MTSNTKLTKNQKEQLRDMIAENPNVGFYTDYHTLVCAYYQDGSVVRFSFAVKSTYEEKFRLKVGKLYALENLLWNGENTILPDWAFDAMVENLSIYFIETE